MDDARAPQPAGETGSSSRKVNIAMIGLGFGAEFLPI